MRVLVLCVCGVQLEEVDFNDSIMMLAFPDELHQTLLSLYKENVETIRRISGNLGMTLQSYRDVKWRINAQVRGSSLSLLTHAPR